MEEQFVPAEQVMVKARHLFEEWKQEEMNEREQKDRSGTPPLQWLGGDHEEDEATGDTPAFAPSDKWGPSWSEGAEGHDIGECRPCAWNWKDGGCSKGASCEYCHLCLEGVLEAKRKQTIRQRRKQSTARTDQVTQWHHWSCSGWLAAHHGTARPGNIPTPSDCRLQTRSKALSAQLRNGRLMPWPGVLAQEREPPLPKWIAGQEASCQVNGTPIADGGKKRIACKPKVEGEPPLPRWMTAVSL